LDILEVVTVVRVLEHLLCSSPVAEQSSLLVVEEHWSRSGMGRGCSSRRRSRRSERSLVDIQA
jgi:hypothetical protein